MTFSDDIQAFVAKLYENKLNLIKKLKKLKKLKK